MSRFGRQQRRAARQTLHRDARRAPIDEKAEAAKGAEQGERWLRILESEEYLLAGCDTWEEFCERHILPTFPAAWRFTTRQKWAFIAGALEFGAGEAAAVSALVAPATAAQSCVLCGALVLWAPTDGSLALVDVVGGQLLGGVHCCLGANAESPVSKPAEVPAP